MLNYNAQIIFTDGTTKDFFDIPYAYAEHGWLRVKDNEGTQHYFSGLQIREVLIQEIPEEQVKRDWRS